MKSKSLLPGLLSVFLGFLVGLLIYGLWAKRTRQFRYVASDPPIAFQPSARNNGKQCQAVYYGLGNGDGIDDPYCYDLQTQLSKAAWDGDVEKIRMLLRDGANADAEVGNFIYSLEAAALKGETEAVRVFLDNGANVNHWHPIRGTPLMKAVDGGSSETVALLISRGANVSLESDGYTALKMARERNKQEIISLLQRAGASK